MGTFAIDDVSFLENMVTAILTFTPNQPKMK